MVNIICTSTEKRKAAVQAMTHTERLAFARKMRVFGMGLIVSGFGCFAGVFAGVSSSNGIGPAIGAGFGAASGLIFSSCGMFHLAQQVLMWDAEFGTTEETAEDVV
mmetsp:Transcript_16893/g.21371  ORF Transcript_16893/g.21371 Transcript_16893/m.21371 type:complete len:106 (-) Transcript_16893:143-460(-)